MENLWKLIEAAAAKGDADLHNIAEDARIEWGELKERLEGLERELDPESYQPKEYPKMLPSGKVVYSAKEEALLTPSSEVKASEGEEA